MTLQVGGSPITANQAATMRGNLMVQSPGNGQAVAMIFDGDSRGLEAARRVLLANAALRRNIVVWDQLSIGATESGSANNGATASTRLAAMAASVAAAKAAGYAMVDVMLTTGGNDFPSGIQPEQTLANIRTYYNAAVAAGVRYLWMVGIYPASAVTSLGGFDLLQSVNAGIRDLALSLPQMVPLMPGERYVDLASTAWTPSGGSDGSFGDVLVDGTHDSFYGHLVSASELEDPAGPFANAFPKLSNSDVMQTFSGFTSAAQTPRGNLLGALGRTRALGGTNSSTGGTVTGTPPNGWTLTGALAGLSVTFSTANSAELQAMFGTLAPVPVVRMTFSGTPTADVTMNLARTNTPSGGVPPGQYVHEMLAHGVAIQGLCGIGMTANVAIGPSPLFGQVIQNGRLPTGPRVPADALPATTHAFGGFARTTQTSTNASLTDTIYLLFESGVAVSGSIDLAGASTRRVLTVA
jgi:hypothetical protein